MAEVLAKAEKYIKGEEALISKNGSSSTSKEKSRTDKRQGRSPKRQREVPKERQRAVPKKTWKPQGSFGSASVRTETTVFTSAVYPRDGRSIAGLARGTTRTVSEMAILDEVRPH